MSHTLAVRDLAVELRASRPARPRPAAPKRPRRPTAPAEAARRAEAVAPPVDDLTRARMQRLLRRGGR